LDALALSPSESDDKFTEAYTMKFKQTQLALKTYIGPTKWVPWKASGMWGLHMYFLTVEI
jgi:hypothetical protein